MQREPMPRTRPTALPAYAPRVRSVHWGARSGGIHPPACHRDALAARAASAAATAATPAARPIAIFARRTVALGTRRTRLVFRHAFRTRHERLHRQAQPSALVAVQQLHRDTIALVHDVFRLVGATVLQLGDVDEAFRARHDL